MDIITIGSATVDVFVKTKKPEIIEHNNHHDVCYAVGQKILVEDLHTETGGGGTNTAAGFAKLGFRTGWVGKVGTDINAKIVLEELKKAKIKVLAEKSKGQTGYSVILTGLEKNRTILAFKGVNNLLSKKNLPKTRPKWYYFSSMLGPALKTLEKAAAFARKNKIPYAFNASMYLAKKGTKKLSPILKGCNLLIINREEAQAMSKKKKTEDCLKTLQKFAKITVITDGTRPVNAFDGKKFYSITPPDVKVAETTGAGDAFNTGMVAGLAMKKPLEYALKLGIAQSVNVIQKIGAKNGLLTRKEANQFIKKHRLVVKKRQKCL